MHYAKVNKIQNISHLHRFVAAANAIDGDAKHDEQNERANELIMQ